MMLLQWHLLVVFYTNQQTAAYSKNSGCNATDMPSTIIITPKFTLIANLLVHTFTDDGNKLTVNLISTILLFDSISQLPSRTIFVKRKLTVPPTTSSNAETPPTAFAIG